jgi:hypothetical protein
MTYISSAILANLSIPFTFDSHLRKMFPMPFE